MDIDKIKTLLKTAYDELGSVDTNNTDEAMYQVYCECNRFIAEEIKRIMKVEGSVTGMHKEIAPLYKMFDFILPTMKRYSETVKLHEENKEN